jgi:hypothetical protein
MQYVCWWILVIADRGVLFLLVIDVSIICYVSWTEKHSDYISIFMGFVFIVSSNFILLGYGGL